MSGKFEIIKYQGLLGPSLFRILKGIINKLIENFFACLKFSESKTKPTDYRGLTQLYSIEVEVFILQGYLPRQSAYTFQNLDTFTHYPHPVSHPSPLSLRKFDLTVRAFTKI